MRITTPIQIETIAWEGELVTSGIVKAAVGGKRPVVTLGRPEIWPVEQALENETGKKWVAPLGNARFWLVRLACTLRPGEADAPIREATLELVLQPQPRNSARDCAYAHNLFPQRLGVEDKTNFTLSLGPELGFADGSSVKIGEVGATIEYRKVFPVIQGYGLGESAPYWEFKPHAAHPLAGSQCVYVVLAARPPASGLRAHVQMKVTTQGGIGPLKYGTPAEAHEHTGFVLE